MSSRRRDAPFPPPASTRSPMLTPSRALPAGRPMSCSMAAIPGLGSGATRRRPRPGPQAGGARPGGGPPGPPGDASPASPSAGPASGGRRAPRAACDPWSATIAARDRSFRLAARPSSSPIPQAGENAQAAGRKEPLARPLGYPAARGPPKGPPPSDTPKSPPSARNVCSRPDPGGKNAHAPLSPPGARRKALLQGRKDPHLRIQDVFAESPVAGPDLQQVKL